MKAHGMARLGRDAEIRYIPSGEAVCKLSLAFDIRVKGEKATQWVEASLWGKRAESLAEFLIKGSMHMFDLSSVRVEEYEQGGEKRHKLVATVDDVTLGPRKDAGGAAERPPAPTQRQAPAKPPAAPKGSQGSGFDDMDDDVPF